MDKPLTVIGPSEKVELPDLQLKAIPAKTDTGADSSTIWASRIKETAKGLECIFFGPDSPHHTGQTVTFKRFTTARVTNSTGQTELRYKVKLRIRVRGRLVRATFTLSDRSQMTYPILLGRRLLRGKFLVDVSKGKS